MTIYAMSTARLLLTQWTIGRPDVGCLRGGVDVMAIRSLRRTSFQKVFDPTHLEDLVRDLRHIREHLKSCLNHHYTQCSNIWCPVVALVAYVSLAEASGKRGLGWPSE